MEHEEDAPTTWEARCASLRALLPPPSPTSAEAAAWPAWEETPSSDHSGTEGADADAGAAEDAFDRVLREFPVPGEIWVHARTQSHYLGATLAAHAPPPYPDDPPILINSWRALGADASPFRVNYGLHNPAARGVVLTAHAVIPNFAWTPRLAVDPDALRTAIMEHPAPADLCILPAVNGTVVRLFCGDDNATWYVADACVLEPCHCADGGGPGAAAAGEEDVGLAACFQQCLQTHYPAGLLRFAGELRADRVWFFALYPDRRTLLFLGTCAVLPHSRLRTEFLYPIHCDYHIHRFLPPAVPLLPAGVLGTDDPAAAPGKAPHHHPLPVFDRLVDTAGLRYTGLYDGVFIVNPATLFGVRLCPPIVVYLTPLLRSRTSLPEFLALRAIEARLMDVHRPTVDARTRAWWTDTVEAFGREVFCATHLFARVAWQVDNAAAWLGGWLGYVASLTWSEWNALDPDLQRLFVLLDYAAQSDETGGDCFRVLCNPRYSAWVAKAIALCIEDEDGGVDRRCHENPEDENEEEGEEEEEEEKVSHHARTQTEV